MKINLRQPTDDDLARFKECLAADHDHSGQDADWWVSSPGEFMVFYDEKGHRAWVRIERVLRVSLQHDQEVPRKNTVSVLNHAFHWLACSARTNNFTEIIFESRAKRLIHFLQKLFGVEPVRENYSLCVDHPAHRKA